MFCQLGSGASVSPPGSTPKASSSSSGSGSGSASKAASGTSANTGVWASAVPPTARHRASANARPSSFLHSDSSCVLLVWGGCFWGGNSLSQSLTALTAPSGRESLAKPKALCFSQKSSRSAKGPIPEGAVCAADWWSLVCRKAQKRGEGTAPVSPLGSGLIQVGWVG